MSFLKHFKLLLQVSYYSIKCKLPLVVKCTIILCTTRKGNCHQYNRMLIVRHIQIHFAHLLKWGRNVHLELIKHYVSDVSNSANVRFETSKNFVGISTALVNLNTFKLIYRFLNVVYIKYLSTVYKCNQTLLYILQ